MTRAKGRRVMTTPNEQTPEQDTSPEATKDVEFYSVFDGKKGRPEGYYLDMKERHDAEDVRAKMEGREPNHEDEGSLPAAVGTMMVIDEMRVENSYYANPAIQHMEPKDVDPIVELPVNVGEAETSVDLGAAAQIARERKSQDEALFEETNTQTDDADNAEPGKESSDLLKSMSMNTTDTSAPTREV